MSPVVDETAGDLPVRDVGLMRGGLMPTVPDTSREVKSWRKHHVYKTKDPQQLFRFPREHLEDLCLRLQEENSVLKQHTRTQERRLRKMSTRLVRLRQPHPGSASMKDRDIECIIQELEARVAMLESQKEILQNKLSLAKQHILDLGPRTPYKYSRGKNVEGDGGVRRAAQTAPARCSFPMEDARMEMERLSSMTDQLKFTEQELTAQTLRETLKEREKEIEGTVRELRKQQADKHRLTIRENVDQIRLQKQLSDKSAALRVTQEKFTDLQEAYEKQLEESQRSLKESQGALLGKVEELTEQLKQERQRTLALEGQLTTTALSVHTMEKLQDRISDLEGERDVIKENYDSLLKSTLSAQSGDDDHVEKQKENMQNGNISKETVYIMDTQRLEGLLQAEREETSKLKLENEKLKHEKQILEESKDHDGEFSLLVRDKNEHLEREAIRYREQVSSLQQKLDSVTKEFDMSVEDLSETLIQIKAFRMQQENRENLGFLQDDGKVENATRELVNIRAAHAETILELQKTRNLLLLEHKISNDLQAELKTSNEKMEREREENRRRTAEKDKLLAKRALQINTLQAQLKELAYSPRNYKRSIPVQYTWPAGDQEVMQQIEDDLPFSQLKAGESLLEIHLQAATFTPAGLRNMANLHPGPDKNEDIVTFCTYCLLDFEMHSTPLVSGSQPNYGFTSRYALTVRDLGRFGGQGSRVRVELHQALGGVQFGTRGSGHMSLIGVTERRGERVSGRVTITGHEGEIVGVVDYWARLFPPAEPVASVVESRAETRMMTQRGPVQILLGWQERSDEQLYDHGCGIPNELVVMLERCVGLSARWPGLLPDSYLTYRFYDLPPHVSQTVRCTADPVFNDVISYPLAVSDDVLHYLRSSSLWVYVFDDSDDQIPPPYLAKTPIPLLSLAAGREIRGDYVLRDPAGGPRGMVRVMLKWKYPFQPAMDLLHVGQGRRMDEQSGVMESSVREERKTEEEPERPIAKPRVKQQTQQAESRGTPTRQKDTKVWPQPPIKQKSSEKISVKPQRTRPAMDRKRSSKSSPNLFQRSSLLTPEPKLTAPTTQRTTKLTVETASRHSPATTPRSSVSDVRNQDIPSVEVSMVEAVEEEEKSGNETSEGTESSESSSSQSDIIIIPPSQKMRKGDKLKVEILSLTFESSSHLVKDKSVQRVYVEYRLLGVPMETTETPMSLRKPTKGEEVHYNFTRVIYIDGSQSAPLRQYLYTMLEGTDPNQGRLKFTVVSEPMDDEEECVDVGHAFLDLQELLLTGNDVIEQQIDIVSVDEDKEVIGYLKVSLEAAKALTGIYQEFHRQDESRTEDETADEKDIAKEGKEEKLEQRREDQIQVLDYDDGDDSDFY